MKGITITRVSILFIAVLMSSCSVRAQHDVPKKAIVQFNKAYGAYDIGNYDEAEKLYRGLIKKYPNFTDAYDGLAKLHQTQGRSAEAINDYKTLLTIKPDHYYALYELGNLYYSMDRYDSARHFYSRLVELYSSDRDATIDRVKRQLNNISFIEYAMENPVDITPINLGKKINTPLEEYSPALTIDGNTLFFTWRDPKYQNEDIHFATKDGDQWKQSKPIGPPINTDNNEGAFSVSADGNFIFFTSCSRPGGQGQCDLWLTMNKNGKWTEPRNLPAPVNSRAWESQPSIASNGRDLYFTSDRRGGYGGTDIWKTSFINGNWSEPVNLGPTINTSGDEQFPFIHSDGKTLYFSSEGHPGMGKSDLFVVHELADGSYSKPQNLGYPINSKDEDWNLIVARDGKTAYYSSNKESGLGGMDLYSFELPEESRAQEVSYVRGFVTDADTKEPLSAWVTLTPLDESAPTEVLADNKGEFIVPLVSDLRYALNVKKPGYLFYSKHFDMPQMDAGIPYEVHIALEKVEVGKGVVMRNVFFDTDRYELKPESLAEIDRLVEFMTNNASVHVEIGGHTDNQGSSQHNQVLSEQRAKAVYDRLVEQGIAADRLSYKGYGDTQPINSNDSEEGRANNRRTAFTVVR